MEVEPLAVIQFNYFSFVYLISCPVFNSTQFGSSQLSFVYHISSLQFSSTQFSSVHLNSVLCITSLVFSLV